MAVSLGPLLLLISLASPAPGGEALVVVNGEPIERRMLEKALEPLRRAGLPKEQINEVARGVLDRLVRDKLLGQFLKREKFTPTEEEIEAEIARRRRSYERSAAKIENRPSYEETLRRQGVSLELLKENPTPGMRFSCYVRRRLTERDVLRAFETRLCEFDGTEVRARHILVDTRKLNTKKERDEARKKAEELRQRLLAGEDFAPLAGEHSACPSGKSAGGDLGFFPRKGRMVESFAAAAFRLRKGGVSRVVETPFGFHVIQVTDIRPGEPLTLDEARGRIVDLLAEEKGKEIYARLHKEADIRRPGGEGE